MEIKIITCHDVYNVGASLQSYALSEYLSQLGHRVQIIDYKPKYLRHYKLWGVDNPTYDRPFLRDIYNLLKLPGRVMARREKRKKAFDEFRKRYLPLTEKTYHSFEELEKNPPEAQLYFAGSDQIWNTIFKNGRDPAFYLAFAPKECIRASYAASFATEHIEPDCKDMVQHYLQRLDYVAVREKSGVALSAALGVQACQVADPVFLISRNQWEILAVSPKTRESYVLVYDFDRNERLHQEAVRVAREKGWKIWSVFPFDEADRCFYDAGPLEFVGLVRGAQMVLSNSFHATAFALIFERPFMVFDRQEQINIRMRDLLASVGIQGNGTDCFKNVSERLNEQIEASKQYLDYVLTIAERRNDETICVGNYSSL